MEPDFDHIYNVMMGYEPSRPDDDVREVFDCLCGESYAESLNARIRIARRLDGNDDGENADCMIIAGAYERMMRIMCEQAFQYGCRCGWHIGV